MVPRQQRRRCHGEHFGPTSSWKQPASARPGPQSIRWLIPQLRYLPLQHGNLVAQDEQLGIFGTGAEHQCHERRQPAQQEVDQPKRHPFMIAE